jgi:hypothetical protein
MRADGCEICYSRIQAMSGVRAFSSEVDTGSREENASSRNFDRLEV